MTAVAIFFPTMYYMTLEIDSQGQSLNLHHFTLFLIIVAHLVCIMRLTFKCYRSYTIQIILLCDAILLILILVVQGYSDSYNSIYGPAIIQMTESSTVIIGICCTIGLTFILSWIVWEHLHMPAIFPYITWIKQHMQDGSTIEASSTLNTLLKDKLTYRQELPENVIRCFGVSGSRPSII